jgi:hypothetical protein
VTSVTLNASRKHPIPRFGRVQVKLAATVFACASSLVTSHCIEPTLRPTFETAPPSRFEHSGFAVARACPSDFEDSVRTPLGMPPEPETQPIGSSHRVALPGKFAPNALLDQGVVD